MIPTSRYGPNRRTALGRAFLVAVPALSLLAALAVLAAPASARTPGPTKPGAPTGVTALPVNGGAIVSWTAPSSDGGSPITGYVASAHQQDCSTSGATTCTLTGLKNGHTYFARVRASNVIGTSKASPTARFIAGQSQNCSNFTPGASLQYCRLSGKNLAGVDLAGANLTGAKVIGTNLQGADLSGANLTGTDLTNAILIDTNLSHANVTKGFFIGADLNGANLTDAVLAQTSFASANLTNANLTGSDLRDATGTDSITWSNTTCPDGTNSNSDGGTCLHND